ncbi:MAG: glycosyltransferase [Candidatus Omnitrophota bacterium]
MGKKKIKIAHVVLNLEIGGLETMVVDLVKGLDKQVFTPIVICLRKSGAMADKLGAAGIEVVVMGNRDRLELKSFFSLASLLRRKKVDIVHCHNTAGYLYGGIAAVLAGFKKIIYTEHGRVFPDSRRRMLAEKALSFFTERIVAVSEDMKRRLVRYEAIDPLKIRVIHNGVDTEKFRKIEDRSWRIEKRKTLGIGESDIVIGSVARLDPVKDLATLIRAFDRVFRAYGENIKLLIAGDGPERGQIESLIRDLKLDAGCKLLGARGDVPDLMNIMDIFALSSKNEGISLTLLEAMACGVPVVATRVGGNPEIVKDGMHGFLVNAGDYHDMAEKIMMLLEDSPRVEASMSRDSLQTMIKQYQDLYMESWLRSAAAVERRV